MMASLCFQVFIKSELKVGVVYVKEGQYTEEEILENNENSRLFDEFLSVLGDKVRLKGKLESLASAFCLVTRVCMCVIQSPISLLICLVMSAQQQPLSSFANLLTAFLPIFKATQLDSLHSSSGIDNRAVRGVFRYHWSYIVRQP